MNGPDFNTEANLHADTVAERHESAKEEAAPLLYRDGNGDWIMFHYGAKYEVAMNGSMLEKAMTALFAR